MTVSGLTLLSRVLGLVRDGMVGHYLGITGAADAWTAAFQFPNYFRRVFGEGAFNAAFVPMYSSKLTEGREEALAFGARAIVLLALILSVVFALCFIFVWPIMKLCNFGFPPETLELTVSLARVTMGYLFFVCLLSAFSAVLNSHKKFFAPACSYAFLNIAFLVGLRWVVPVMGNPAQVLAWSCLAAGFIQLLVVVIPAYRLGLRLHFKLPKIDSDLKKLGVLMLPGLMSAGIQQTNLLVSGLVASAQVGAKTTIYYADRIHQLPLGLIGIAFGVVLLPEIAQRVKKNEITEAREGIQTGVTQAMFLTLPAMVGMMVLAEPMLFALFKSGKFTADAAALSGQALAVFALGCPAYVLTRVLQPGYFARQDTKTPMRYTFVSAGTNIVLCGIAFGFLNGTGKLHIGCAAATSVAGWVNVVLLARGLGKHELLQLGGEFWKRMGKMLVASVIMGVGIWFMADLFSLQLHADGRVGRISTLMGVIAIGCVLYFLVAHLTRAMSLRELKSGFKRG